VEHDRHSALACARAACSIFDWDTALPYAKLAVELAPDDAGGWVDLAMATSKNRHLSMISRARNPDSAGLLDRAIGCENAWPELYLIRARQEPEASGDAGALAILAQGVDRFPEVPGLRIELANRIVGKLPDDALTLLAPLLQATMPPAEALAIAVEAYEGIDVDRSLAHLDALEHFYPLDRWPLVRARILIERGKPAFALPLIEPLQSDPSRLNRLNAWLWKAAAAVESGQMREAVACAENASRELLCDTDGWGGDLSEHRSWRDPADRLLHMDHQPTYHAIRSWLAGADTNGAATTMLDVLWGGIGVAPKLDVPKTYVAALNETGDYRLLAKISECAVGLDDELAMQAACGYVLALIEREAQPDCFVGTVSRIAESWHSARWTPEGEELPPDPAVQMHQYTVFKSVLDAAAERPILPPYFLEELTDFYADHLREWIADNDPAGGLRLIDDFLKPYMAEEDILFETGLLLLRGRDDEHSAAQAAALYQQYVREYAPNPGAWNNLGVALERLGRRGEAANAFDAAAGLSEGEVAEKYRQAASRIRSQAGGASPRKRAAQGQAAQGERKRLDTLALAPQRWGQLKYYERQLLCTLDRISGFESWTELAELSGQDVRYVRTNYRRLSDLGMIIEEKEGSFRVNPEVEEMVRREFSHSVAARIIRSSEGVVLRPIFGSGNEYKIYAALLQIFPNNLVFPNMALQTIFTYDRLKPILDKDDFNYFLRSTVDFCIVSTTTYLPLLCFEVDSYWHDQPKQIDRDEAKDRIFTAGGCDLIRLRPYGKPSDAALRGDVILAVNEWLSKRSLPDAGLGFNITRELDLTQIRIGDV
jgi:tetratricopeptide (TPR) repeat protein